MGLVAWKGTLTGGVAAEGFGAGFFSINLTSECISGQHAIVDILATGPALGLGGFLEITSSELEVNDGFDYLKPDNFNGGFQLSSGGVSLVVGYGGYAISIGDGRYEHPAQNPRRGANGVGHGVIKGYGAGVSVVAGTSTVTGVRYECCDE